MVILCPVYYLCLFVCVCVCVCVCVFLPNCFHVICLAVKLVMFRLLIQLYHILYLFMIYVRKPWFNMSLFMSHIIIFYFLRFLGMLRAAVIWFSLSILLIYVTYLGIAIMFFLSLLFIIVSRSDYFGFSLLILYYHAWHS